MPTPIGHDKPAFTYRLIIALLFFLLAVALRMPSTGESFWVDELHTAWCTSGSLAQVNLRASLGNQQPLYFVGLWGWQNWSPNWLTNIYPTEAWARLTSVLSSSLVAAGLVWITSRTSGSRLGGIAAGLIASIDNNSLFFGTELRPYAMVMLCGAIALTVSTPTNQNDSQAASDELRRWWWLNIIVLLSACLHLTSLITLGPLLLLSLVRNRQHWWVRPARLKGRWVVPATLWLVAGLYWLSSQNELWEARHQWASFAVPHDWQDVWRLWPWSGLLFLPAITLVFPGSDNSTIRRLHVIAVMASVLGGTAVCYAISFGDIVPLWHRRYLIASLPILFWFFGHQIGDLWRRQTLWSRLLASLILVGGVGSITFQQRTWPSLITGQVPTITRGEDWRGAIHYVNHQATHGDKIWIDPALIEQNAFQGEVSTLPQSDYLRFVVLGPYALRDDLRPVSLGSDGTQRWLNEHRTSWLITRRGIPSSSIGSTASVKQFGRVTVLSPKE